MENREVLGERAAGWWRKSQMHSAFEVVLSGAVVRTQQGMTARCLTGVPGRAPLPQMGEASQEADVAERGAWKRTLSSKPLVRPSPPTFSNEHDA